MAYTVLDSKNINKKKNLYKLGGSGTKPERDDIAENSKLIDYSSGEKFYYDPSKSAGNKWQPDKEQSGGSGGGSLPANFPAEGIANAGKYVGFDENGDYDALEAPEGGYALPPITGKNGKILGVTLDQSDEEQLEWVDVKLPLIVNAGVDPNDQTRLISDKTYGEIAVALESGRRAVLTADIGTVKLTAQIIDCVRLITTDIVTITVSKSDFEEATATLIMLQGSSSDYVSLYLQ